MKNKKDSRPFHSVKEELVSLKHYELAFTDQEFMLRDELRPVRLQLELLKPELVLQDNGIDETIVFFGSARLPEPKVAQQRLSAAEASLKDEPDNAAFQKEVRKAKNCLHNSAYLEEAAKLARMASTADEHDFVVVTGGGPSFMEAASRGAKEAGARSVALNVLLAHEQAPNRYVDPELTFQFHYFAIRKMHFLLRAKAMAAFPGGFGTLDEVFESLTLMQTQKIDRMPLVLFNERFWRNIVNFDALVEEGTIDEEDLALFHYVETAEQAWKIITDFYKS